MLRLSIGLSRQSGEANSPPFAASANLEVELDSDLINRPDRLREHARRLFRLAAEAIGQGRDPRDGLGARPTLSGDGQRDGRHRGRRGRRPSREQILAIHDLATRRKVDLDGLGIGVNS
jgi:hypothetical protein